MTGPRCIVGEIATKAALAARMGGMQPQRKGKKSRAAEQTARQCINTDALVHWGPANLQYNGTPTIEQELGKAQFDERGEFLVRKLSHRLNAL